MIRGFNIDVKTSDNEEAFKELNFIPLKVSQMISLKVNCPMPLFLIHLNNTQKNRKIHRIEALFYQILIAENYKMLTHAIQFL